MQIFIRSHGSDMTDVVCGAVGVAIGALVGVWTFDRKLDTSADETFGALGVDRPRVRGA